MSESSPQPPIRIFLLLRNRPLRDALNTGFRVVGWRKEEDGPSQALVESFTTSLCILVPPRRRGPAQQLLAALLAACLFPVLVFGQTSLGAVAGSVLDPAGAAIPDARVELTNTETGIVRTTTTNGDGIYRFDAVDLGMYNLRISQRGFATHNSTALRVEANRATTVDAILAIGVLDTVIKVSAQTADLLVKDAPLRGGNFSPQEVSRLPLSGLEPITLAATLPGVVAPTGSTVFGPTGVIVGFSVNGQRPRGNNYLLDGTDNNDITYGGNAQPFSITDAVEEVSAQTANFGVEFGRASGGIFNVITKSGTNTYHGTVLWQYQSQAFNSRSNLDHLNAAPQSVFSHNVYGFTFGGPWRKNKTFFFAAFQQDTFHSTRNYSFVVPTADSVVKLRELFPSNPRLDLYLSALGDLRGSANLKLLSLGLGRGTIAVGSAAEGIPLTDQGPQLMLRVDHNLTEAHRLSFRYIYDRRKTSPAITDIPGVPATVPFPGYMAEQDVGHQNFLVIDNFAISPQWTNEFRFSLGHINTNWPGEVSPRSLPPAFTLPRINIPNIDTPGLSGVFPAFLNANTWLFQETQSKLSGRHTFRYGAEFVRQLTRSAPGLGLRGAITYTETSEFSGFANFLDDFSGPSGRITRSFGNAFYHPNQFRQAYFFQDAWKATPWFMVTAGLRYENFGQPANVLDFPAFAGFDPSNFLIPNHVQRYDRNFAPAIGLAWSPAPRSRLLRELLGERKTVWRTGYQVSYEAFTNQLIDGVLSASPNTLSTLVVGSGVGRGTPNWFAQLPTAGGSAMPTDPQDGVLDEDIRSPYTERWSFGFQRELPHGLLIDLSYVGAESHHLFVREDLNPRQLSGARPYPQLGQRIVIHSDGNSAYNALQFGIARRFVKGLQMAGSYTWSRNIDSASESFATRANPGLGLTSMPASQGGLMLDRGLSDYHRGQRLSVVFFWELPGTRQGFLNHAFAGWAISGIATFQSGMPFTVQNGLDRNNDGIQNDRPDIGNPNAPLNTRAVLSANCATGYLNPDTGACVTPREVHFLEGSGLPTGRTVGRVKITPIGQRTGEYCARDRALLFEDPTGIRILYDPGVTVTGGGDPRLGEVDAILVSHSHFDHLGYRRLTQNPDDPQSPCDDTLQTTRTGNTTTAEIAAVKNTAMLVNGSMTAFLSRKIQNILGVAAAGCPSSGAGRFGDNETVVPLSSPCTLTAAFGSLVIFTRAAGTPGVRINTVAALHSDSPYNPLLLFPADGLGKLLDDNGLQGYDGLANGFVLTFTSGLRVYLTGDTGPTSDMAFVVRGIYHPNLTVANMDSLNNMGPEEAAYAMKELVHTAAVIPSHAEQAVTLNGKLIPGTRTAEFIRLLGDIPAYLPLSGRTMQFDGEARCVAGCGEN